MSDDLKSALEQSSRVLEVALADARAELAVLDARRAELVSLIGRAESMQRTANASDGDVAMAGKHLTLHEALVVVLRDHDNRWMTVKELAGEVNDRRLYRKKDGSEVEPAQVHARTKNYEHVFEKNGPNVRMRDDVAAEEGLGQ